MTLVLESLTKRFGAVLALDGISLQVERGSIFGFLGANGAGKTTTMRIVLGILRPDSGTASWDGRPTVELPRRTWGYLPEERGLYPQMEVLEQLAFFASLHGVPGHEGTRIARDWLGRFRIAEYERRRAEQLSKGNQQKVQLIAAILHAPPVLLLDEPFVGLDPVNVAILKEALLHLRDGGTTIVFSTHQMEMVEELCESVAIVDKGRVLLSGSTREVKRSTGKRVVRLALGDHDGTEWLERFDGAHVVRAGEDYTELEVGTGCDPEAILAAALGRGAYVTRFEIADPSIEQIFIERVGRPPSEDHHLAAAVPGDGR